MTSTDGLGTAGALARRAREALAHCGGGSLHIHGVGTPDALSAQILLYDDGGRPTFLCDPASAVAHAAAHGRGAVLDVVAPLRDRHGMTTLVLAGRLRVVGTEHVDGAAVTLVGLELGSVTVEHDDPASPTVVSREIPLAEFDRAVPDPVDAAAARILRHTNHCHGEDLRAFVAGLRGLPASEIAAAEITALDVRGLQLQWLDRRGSHTARVAFAVAADSPGTLGSRLRDTLAGHPDSTDRTD